MTDTRSEYQKMLAGGIGYGPDAEMMAMQAEARRRLRVFNETPEDDLPARQAAFSALIGKPFHGLVRSPFMVDYGIHITIGRSYVNMNCTFLDSNTITVGDGCAIAPNVQLLAAGHPIHPAERLISGEPGVEPPFRAGTVAAPIVIGDEVWLGGAVIVLGGVTIGRGTTVGAGSVVTKSLPPFVVAAGNPARVIRELARRPTFFHPDPNDP
ncbi:MAG TPA: sugar O-acetyltransferase [Bauldia sp.]|nr:sugar O-acetyltransferase [Bauldia sp.]